MARKKKAALPYNEKFIVKTLAEAYEVRENLIYAGYKMSEVHTVQRQDKFGDSFREVYTRRMA